jgi:23S rRNA (adenine2030-N6)-methyltransferase
MNYRHVYHAGNFADVVKHIVLTLVLEHLKLKPAPFRVIDTHAGVGVYDLSGEQAQKTGEWRDGVGRLLAEEPPEALRPLLAPYLDVVRRLNGGASLRHYPGSPRLARALLRRGDQLIANELHPEDAVLLQQHFAGDPQTKVLRLDAWIALKSLLPPKERRGLVLIDPPFEEPGEFARIAKGLRDAVRRFATGTYLVWFPIKDPGQVASFYRELSKLRFGRVLCLELMIRAPRNPDVLNGCGLVVLNPPFTLAEKAEQVLPYLAGRLAQGTGAAYRLDWITSAGEPAQV